MQTKTRRSYSELQRIFKGIVAGYKAHKPIKVLAKELNIKEKTLVNYAFQLRKLGVDLPRAPKKTRKTSPMKYAMRDFVASMQLKQMKRIAPKDPVQLSLFDNQEVRRIPVQQITD